MYNYSDYYGGTGGTGNYAYPQAPNRTISPMLPFQQRFGPGADRRLAFQPGPHYQPLGQQFGDVTPPLNSQPPMSTGGNQLGYIPNIDPGFGPPQQRPGYGTVGSPYGGAPQYGAPNQQPQYNPYTGQPYGQQPWWYKAGMGSSAPFGGSANGGGKGGWFGNAYFNPAMTGAPTQPSYGTPGIGGVPPFASPPAGNQYPRGMPYGQPNFMF